MNHQKAQATWDNPKDWIDKHKGNKLKKSKFPDMGSYKPHPVMFDTFGLALEKQDPNKKRPSKLFKPF